MNTEGKEAAKSFEFKLTEDESGNVETITIINGFINQDIYYFMSLYMHKMMEHTSLVSTNPDNPITSLNTQP